MFLKERFSKERFLKNSFIDNTTLIKSVLVVITVTGMFLAQPVLSSAQETLDTAIPSERQQELKYMVQQDCGSCHGMTLKGGLGPSLLPQRISVLPEQYLIDAVTHGREGTPMPPWEPILTRAEIVWIVQQLKSGSLAQKPRD